MKISDYISREGTKTGTVKLKKIVLDQCTVNKF